MSYPQHVYITSDSRSGSTLLDLLMGGHPEIISVGELRRLHDHYTDRLACTCNRAVPDCPFWQSVDSIMRNSVGPLADAETLVPGSSSPFADLVYGLNMAALRKCGRKPGYIADSISIAENNVRIVDAISVATGRHVVVNSSKVPKIARLMYLIRPNDTKVIFLRRDGRGIAYSRSRHAGFSFLRGTFSWMLYIAKSGLFWISLPAEHRLSVRYEALCENPGNTMQRICDFLGIPFDVGMTVLRKTDRHNICGSPMRFEYDDTGIRLDDRWREAVSEKDRLKFFLIGGVLFNWMLGYK